MSLAPRLLANHGLGQCLAASRCPQQCPSLMTERTPAAVPHMTDGEEEVVRGGGQRPLHTGQGPQVRSNHTRPPSCTSLKVSGTSTSRAIRVVGLRGGPAEGPKPNRASPKLHWRHNTRRTSVQRCTGGNCPGRRQTLTTSITLSNQWPSRGFQPVPDPHCMPTSLRDKKPVGAAQSFPTTTTRLLTRQKG